MKRRLRWTSAAVEDRNEIYDYIAADKPSAALALDELFEQKAAMLLDFPLFGRTGRLTGTRELIAHQNYMLVYDAHGDTVRILRVMHGARRWPPKSDQ